MKPTPQPTNQPAPEPMFQIYEAEDQSTYFGVTPKTDSPSNAGYTGTGYADFGGRDTYMEFANVDGGLGGPCILAFRYAQGSNDARPGSVSVNGQVVGELQFALTSTWEDWQYGIVETTCAAGNNVIRVTATTSAGGPNIDHLKYSTSATNQPAPEPKFQIYEAEDQSTYFGVTPKTDSPSNAGYTGTGYADFGGRDTYMEFANVDGGLGGPCILAFRYAQGSNDARPGSVSVNGQVVGELQFALTSTWEDWQYGIVETTCAAGNNVIRVTATTSAGGPNIDHLKYSTSANISPPVSMLCCCKTLSFDCACLILTSFHFCPNNTQPTTSPIPSPTSKPTDEPTPGQSAHVRRISYTLNLASFFL